ncbi:MAG TPA: hypothetical protein VI197_06210 [Polyangiaceae bacterium]
MPDVIEAASSGRAKCRACQQKIAKGELRFGAKVPNPFGDGEATHYYHLICAADRRPESFRETLAATELEVPDRTELERVSQLGIDHRRLPRAARAERASSGRAQCRHCKEPIGKGDLRIALEYIEDGMASGGGFIHLGCAQEYFGTTELRGRLERTSPKLEAADFEELAKVLT